MHSQGRQKEVFASGEKEPENQHHLHLSGEMLHLYDLLLSSRGPRFRSHPGRCGGQTTQRCPSAPAPQRPAGLGGGRALSHEGLAGVQQDLAALDDHALDGQVFPDVLRLADLVMHYPVGAGSDTSEMGGHHAEEDRRGLPRSGRKPGAQGDRGSCVRENESEVNR